MQNGGAGKRTGKSALAPEQNKATDDSGDNKNASAGGSIASTSESGALSSSELRHIVDPFDGSYKTKVSIPKNFTGLLFLSGLNITALSNRLISVRFRFGRDLEPVTIDAVVGRAPGLTPQTDTEVLILDMNNRPFENIRLLYDLYDYSDYRDDANPLIETKSPTNDPRNVGLYCRGLKLEHDPTFLPGNNNARCDGIVACPFSVNQCNGGAKCASNGSPQGLVIGDVANIHFLDELNNKCYRNINGTNWVDVSVSGGQILSPTGEKCLYAYAKIKDKGLIQANNVAFNPVLPQIDISGGGYATDSKDQQLTKCLPGILDLTTPANSVGHLKTLLNATSVAGAALLFGNTVTTADNSSYTYQGPYRALDEAAWEISGGAVFSNIATGANPVGLFQGSLAGAPTINGLPSGNGGFNAFLFPRAGKMSLQSNVTHFSATTPFAPIRAQNSLAANGNSDFMDGCNIRVSNHDSFSNEGISSCNVTAVIEILAKDPTTGETVILGNANHELKLQLIRPSQTDFEGKEVLFTAMKSCQTSNGCGGDECCYNNRCWSKNLVSQCIEDAPTIGNGGVGASCGSDYECSSLCCNQNTSSCAVHINSATEKVLCSKSPGQRCVAEEFCRIEQVPTCQVTKTGIDPQGKQLCALRCFNIPTHGSCTNGFCQLPAFPDPETFDPDNPDCTNAKDPPVLNITQ